MKENRQSPRIEARLRCWCESDRITFFARIANLSEGGLFLRTSAPLAPGSRTRLRLQGRELEEVSTAATVVWNREQPQNGPAGMGLRFDVEDPTLREAIRRIMAAEQRSRA